MARRPRKVPIPAAMQRIAKRSLLADPHQVRAYVPDELALGIAESLLSGKLFFKDIAEDLRVSPTTISSRMKDPVACAWISEQITAMARHRIGLVDAALINRCLSGDVAAMKLFYQRFDKIVRRSEIVTRDMGFDPSKLSDEQLHKLVLEKQRQHAKTVQYDQPK